MPTPVKWSAADFELINSESPEGEPWLAASPDGRFNLTFFESFPTASPAYTDIETRVYSATGLDTGTGPAPTFSATTIDHQGTVAYFPDGRNVYVWTEEPAAGGGNLEDVYASVYVGGLPAVNRFLVAGGAGIQHDPVVAASAAGFAIALADDSVATGQLILKFYNAVGGLITTVTDADDPEGVNTPPGNEDDYRDVEIAALANGNYVVTWTDDANFDIWARIYSPTGVAQTGLIEIEPGGSNATFPDVTPLADGRFLVTYEQFGINTVRGRIYEANGTASVGPFTIATTAANATNQQVQSAALNDGRFVTVWRNIAGNIEGQMMFANGTADGAAFAINGDGVGGKGRPTVATLADGRFAVSWESGAGATATIFTTIFDPREQRISQSASSLADDWVGSAFSDTMFMGVGNDRASGGEAADFMFGEAGNDALFGDGSDDRINGGTGVDTMTGGGGNDYYFVDNVGDVTTELAGQGIDTVRSTVSRTLSANTEKLYLDGTATNGTGNALSNFIFGNAQNNFLDGLAGADRMYGGAGDDTFVVDSSGDLVFETIAGAAGGVTDTVEASVTHTLSSNVEYLIMTGAANINGTGNNLANLIIGSGGNNFIDGKGGTDTLTGNGGADQFLFTTTLNATTNTDTITDFDPANDFLRLDDAIFTQIAPGFLSAAAFHAGTAATTAAHRIIYNSATGDVFYDANGVGGAGQIRFANIGIGTALTQADIFVF